MSTYVISAEEVLWGGLLLAVTMSIHGVGMLITLRVTDSIKAHSSGSALIGLGTVILASWMILMVSPVEIAVWAGFFLLKRALLSHSVAFYYALVNYTTLDSGYLPQRWHLLEGLLAMAGLLTLAWSTGILYTVVQDFQRSQLRKDSGGAGGSHLSH
jgi:hypothetical protein